jgi:hypothetical protein
VERLQDTIKATDIDRLKGLFTDGWFLVLSSDKSPKRQIGDISLRCDFESLHSENF